MGSVEPTWTDEMMPVTWDALSLRFPRVTPKHVMGRAKKFTEFRKDSIRAALGLDPAALSRGAYLMPVARAALSLIQKFTEFRKVFTVPTSRVLDVP